MFRVFSLSRSSSELTSVQSTTVQHPVSIAIAINTAKSKNIFLTSANELNSIHNIIVVVASSALFIESGLDNIAQVSQSLSLYVFTPTKPTVAYMTRVVIYNYSSKPQSFHWVYWLSIYSIFHEASHLSACHRTTFWFSARLTYARR